MGSEVQWVTDGKHVRDRTCGLGGAEKSFLTIQILDPICTVQVQLYVVCAKRGRKYVAGAQGATQDYLSVRPTVPCY
jgi:hypothetical protein